MRFLFVTWLWFVLGNFVCVVGVVVCDCGALFICLGIRVSLLHVA